MQYIEKHTVHAGYIITPPHTQRENDSVFLEIKQDIN